MRNLREKRTDDRTPLRQTISFELSRVEAEGFATVVQMGESVDLSSGGMGMTTAYPLHGGQVVKLFFPVTEGAAALPVFTEVMWSEAVDGLYRSGLRFLS